MKYREYKVGFTFDVPDYFSEVRESSFEVFDVPENTLKYFIILDDDGEIERSFSFNRDDEPVKTKEDFLNAVESNISNMEELGYTRVYTDTITTESGREIVRHFMCDTEMEENLAIVMYFTHIKNNLVCSSTFGREFFDSPESEMLEIYNSIEEL